MNRILLTIAFTLALSVAVFSQIREPSISTKPWIIKTKQDVSDLMKVLEKKPGNTNEDVVAAAGNQTRIAIFHDSKRENDLVEIHDGADDIYVVLDGQGTLHLGGKLVEAKEVSPGEWRGKSSVDFKEVVIKKGDVIFVPRGTAHQRTVTGKGFAMILVKIFADTQPTK